MIKQFLDRYRHKRGQQTKVIPSALEAMHEASICKQQRNAEAFQAAQEHLEKLIKEANIHENLKGADPHYHDSKHKRP